MDYNINIESNNKFFSIDEFEWIKCPKRNKTQLGTGSFGQVKLARHKATNIKYAIKIMDLKTMRSNSELKGVEQEIQIHLQLDHSHIVKLYDAFIENNHVYMVMEWLKNGNLYSYVYKKQKLPEKEVFKYFFQTCLAFQYIHSLNIVHRDLKPENLLLDENNNIKLCDFGWCSENIEEQRNTFCGTLEYMAPEIIFSRPYDYRIDIWAIGILLYELSHGHAPFKGKQYEEVKHKLIKGEVKFAPDLSSGCRSLIAEILQSNPNRRVSLDDIFNNSYVQKMLQQDTQMNNIDKSKYLRNQQSKGNLKQNNDDIIKLNSNKNQIKNQQAQAYNKNLQNLQQNGCPQQPKPILDLQSTQQLTKKFQEFAEKSQKMIKNKQENLIQFEQNSFLNTSENSNQLKSQPNQINNNNNKNIANPIVNFNSSKENVQKIDGIQTQQTPKMPLNQNFLNNNNINKQQQKQLDKNDINKGMDNYNDTKRKINMQIQDKENLSKQVPNKLINNNIFMQEEPQLQQQQLKKKTNKQILQIDRNPSKQYKQLQQQNNNSMLQMDEQKNLNNNLNNNNSQLIDNNSTINNFSSIQNNQNQYKFLNQKQQRQNNNNFLNDIVKTVSCNLFSNNYNPNTNINNTNNNVNQLRKRGYSAQTQQNSQQNQTQEAFLNNGGDMEPRSKIFSLHQQKRQHVFMQNNNTNNQAKKQRSDSMAITASSSQPNQNEFLSFNNNQNSKNDNGNINKNQGRQFGAVLTNITNVQNDNKNVNELSPVITPQKEKMRYNSNKKQRARTGIFSDKDMQEQKQQLNQMKQMIKAVENRQLSSSKNSTKKRTNVTSRLNQQNNAKQIVLNLNNNNNYKQQQYM